jgi:hypothetical protein
MSTRLVLGGGALRKHSLKRNRDQIQASGEFSPENAQISQSSKEDCSNDDDDGDSGSESDGDGDGRGRRKRPRTLTFDEQKVKTTAERVRCKASMAKLRKERKRGNRSTSEELIFMRKELKVLRKDSTTTLALLEQTLTELRVLRDAFQSMSRS